MEQQVKDNPQELLHSLWFMIKRNFVIMLIIVVLVTGLGIAYSFVKKPNYTATVKVCYLVEGKDGTYEDVTAMMAFVDTVVDFVDEGVVLDRASYYYKKWIEAKSRGAELDEFLHMTAHLNYDSSISIVDSSYKYDKTKISTATTKVDNQTQFFYNIKYKASTRDEAIERTRILVNAYEQELQMKGQNNDFVYFADLKISILDKGVLGVDVDVSKMRITVLAGLLGVALAVAVALIKDKTDTTVRNKEELEQLTDTKVLALLDA